MYTCTNLVHEPIRKLNSFPSQDIGEVCQLNHQSPTKQQIRKLKIVNASKQQWWAEKNQKLWEKYSQEDQPKINKLSNLDKETLQQGRNIITSSQHQKLASLPNHGTQNTHSFSKCNNAPNTTPLSTPTLPYIICEHESGRHHDRSHIRC